MESTPVSATLHLPLKGEGLPLIAAPRAILQNQQF